VSSDTLPADLRRKAAVDKWLATEIRNEETNERLSTINEEYNILPRVTYARFMDSVRHYVKMVIGEVPSVETLNGGFSGGASTSRARVHGHPARKYLGKADVTARALPWAELLLEESPLWREFRDGEQFSVVEGNVLFTVPKTSEIDRVACKEPDLNMYLQRGVGNFIRRRLRLFGIDLNNQSRNAAAAKEGSRTGDLATIDLSSASDSISRELVFQSVSPFWFTLLDDLRCDRTIVDGEVHVNEMFSSMGNGFTFELESLLFWAIAKATAHFAGDKTDVILVYGDDIVVPSDWAPRLIYALSVLGFRTNESKTFFTGPFRESCGGHYYAGLDVTPFYIRKPVARLVDCIHVCNQIRKWSTSGIGILWDDLEELWEILSQYIPKCFWGGVDVNDKSRLVSYWRPNKARKLLPDDGESSSTALGGYLLWLNTVEHRLSEFTIETSQEEKVVRFYRTKRCFDDARWRGGIFLSELRPSMTGATPDLPGEIPGWSVQA